MKYIIHHEVSLGNKIIWQIQANCFFVLTSPTEQTADEVSDCLLVDDCAVYTIILVFIFFTAENGNEAYFAHSQSF